MKEIRKTDQYAFVAFLIDQAARANQELGKSTLQMTVHLMQELGGVDAGYRFALYTYGPYSASLAGDLDVIEISDGAKVSYSSSDNRYRIHASEHTPEVVKIGENFVNANQPTIERVLETFGDRSVRSLMLLTTIAYLRRHSPEDEFEDDKMLAKRVRDLKPKFEEAEVGAAIHEVKDFLSVASKSPILQGGEQTLN